MTTAGTYSPSSKFFHWLIAIIVIPLLAFSFFLEDLPKSVFPFAINMHKSFGVLILCLMLVRWLIIVKNGKPALPDTIALWQKVLSRVVQYGLYLSLIAMPLVGWIMSTAANRPVNFFYLFKVSLPGVPVDKALAKNMFTVHQWIALVIVGLLVLHIAGALKHHFIDKDIVLKRMLPEK